MIKEIITYVFIVDKGMTTKTLFWYNDDDDDDDENDNNDLISWSGNDNDDEDDDACDVALLGLRVDLNPLSLEPIPPRDRHLPSLLSFSCLLWSSCHDDYDDDNGDVEAIGFYLD